MMNLRDRGQNLFKAIKGPHSRAKTILLMTLISSQSISLHMSKKLSFWTTDLTINLTLDKPNSDMKWPGPPSSLPTERCSPWVSCFHHAKFLVVSRVHHALLDVARCCTSFTDSNIFSCVYRCSHIAPQDTWPHDGVLLGYHCALCVPVLYISHITSCLHICFLGGTRTPLRR